MTDIITLFAAAGGIGTQILVLVLLYCLFTKKHNADIFVFFARHALVFSFLMALVAMVTSLYYSEIALFAPCALCWWHRIFMYPLVFILGLALLRKKDHAILPYGILLSSMGCLIALYHAALPLFNPSGVCSPTDTVSCTAEYFTMFGYINIPVLSLSGFALITVLLIAAQRFYAKTK